MPSSFQYSVERHRDLQQDGAGCSNEPLPPMRFERNTVGLRKIAIDGETPWPRERAAKLRRAV